MAKKKANQVYAQLKLNEMINWERDYRRRIIDIIKRKGINLSPENIPLIILATSFDALSSEPENISHCPCYKSKISCHPQLEDLSCCLCNCPNYESVIIQQDEKTLLGRCKIDSKKGKYYQTPQFPEIFLWDCSDCSAYHSPKQVQKYLQEHFEEFFSN